MYTSMSVPGVGASGDLCVCLCVCVCVCVLRMCTYNMIYVLIYSSMPLSGVGARDLVLCACVCVCVCVCERERERDSA